MDKGQLQRTQQLAPTLNNLGKQPRPGLRTRSARCPQYLQLHPHAQDAGTIAHGTSLAIPGSKGNASSHLTRRSSTIAPDAHSANRLHTATTLTNLASANGQIKKDLKPGDSSGAKGAARIHVSHLEELHGAPQLKRSRN